MNHSMRLLDWYRLIYRPARHTGDSHRSTVDTYEREIRKFDQYMREQHGRQALVSDLSDAMVCAVMDWLIRRGRQRSTANKFLTHINAIWAFAVRRGELAKGPDNDKLRVDQDDPIAFMPDEKKALLAAAPQMVGHVGSIEAGLWWETFLLTMFSFGPRLAVMLQTPTANLDMDRGEILLPSAFNKQRREQRRDLYRSAIEGWKLIEPHRRGLVNLLDDFKPKGKAKYRERSLTEEFKKVHVLAGLAKNVDEVPSHWLTHCIRRTVASEIYAVAGIHVACEVLGHSDISVTWRYIDPRYKSQIRVRDLLDDPIGAPPDPRPIFRIYRPEAG